MPGSATLELELTDTLDCDLDDRTLIELSDHAGPGRYRNSETVRRKLTLTGVACSPAALYRVRVAPSRYRARQVFVPLEEGHTARRRVMFPVNPRSVRDIQAPPFDALPGALSRLLEKPVYENLSALQKAGLLNIAAKGAATALGDGTSCLDHFEHILEMRQDRLWAGARPSLEEEVRRSSLLVKRSGVLHKPPSGCTRTGSFKTRDRDGNLQLTFFRNGKDWIVEADIDEADGLRHLFEVVRNRLRGPTNPYDVREILIAGQGIDPGYRFLLS